MNIADDETTVLVAEARALSEVVGGDRAAALERLAAAVESGPIDDEELVATAGEVAALSLETGRARAVHGPTGVRVLTALWKRSPQGNAVAGELDELNTALTSLRGLAVSDVRVAATGPGSFAITIAAGEYEVRLAVDRHGVRLRSINVGSTGVGE
ncbi:MAG: hypothetical protein ABR518_01095 [Actinomycetota bacterium]